MRVTFPALLADQVRSSGPRPLVTFYDDATGERAELSATTYANWVAKTAGLLQDELGAERGGTVLVDLPTHWLATVWLGAAWSTGLAVTDDPGVDSDLVVCGPQDVHRYAEHGGPVVALSLLPMASRFAEPLPDGVLDYGVAVWGQPDSFAPYDAPTADDVAWRTDARTLSQAEVLSQAAGSAWGEPGTRLLTDLRPSSAPGLSALVGPLLAGGGTVWVARPDPAGWEHRAEVERATRVHRA